MSSLNQVLNTVVSVLLVVIEPDGVSSSVIMALLLVLRVILSEDVVVVLRFE